MNRRQSIKLLLAASAGTILPQPFAMGLRVTTPDTTVSSSTVPAIGGQPVVPAFTWLNLGEVKPTGWIKEQMLRDLTQGFAGCLGELCHEASSDIFVSHRNSLKLQNSTNQDGVNWWNGESEGNWRAGFIMMAYLTDDEVARKKADEYVQHILGSQDPDGYMGIFAPDLRFTREGELWTQACLLRGLLDYAELTGNRDVMNAVVRAADLTINVYGSGKTAFPWGENHDLMISDVMERLFELTGDAKYRDFTLWFYQAWSKNAGNADTSLSSLLNLKTGFTQHGVHTYESIRVPLWLWMATGREDLGRATQNAFEKLSRYTEPGGSAVSEENIDNLQPDPTFTEYEYCSTKEIQFTLESALQKTGQSTIGDRIEKIWFNDAQGARLPNGRAITYLTPDNRMRCDGLTPDGTKAEPRNKFSPTHADVAVCCNPNATNVAPLYVRGMWMRHGNGLAALLYGPCTVSTKIGTTRVNIEERTNYPFENTVEIEVRPDSEIEFPLLLRNPEWSGGTTVGCDGGKITRKGDYWVITKKWRDGDKVRIKFTPTIQEVSSVNGEIALQYGALMFAQPIDAQKEIIKNYPVHGFEDIHLEPVPGAYEELAFPAGARWKEFGFEPVQLTKDIIPLRPFDKPIVALQGKMIRTRDGVETIVTLVPLGNASTLRRLTFPVSS